MQLEMLLEILNLTIHDLFSHE